MQRDGLKNANSASEIENNVVPMAISRSGKMW